MSREPIERTGSRRAAPSWLQRWRSWLRTLGLVDLNRNSQPSMRVKRVEVNAGRVQATVQEASGATCSVEIMVAPWSDEEWQRALDALASQAIFAAQLLAGDLPPELDSTLSAAGVALLPERVSELVHQCSCDRAQGRGCEHLPAVYLALGDMVADDPWLLLRLRGRDPQQVLRALRDQRSRAAELAPAARFVETSQAGGDAGFYRLAPEQSAETEVIPLEAQMENFWGSAKLLDEFRPQIVRPVVELALLRRLGPPPFDAAGTETYERLAALYRRITDEALRVAYAEETSDGSEDAG